MVRDHTLFSRIQITYKRTTHLSLPLTVSRERFDVDDALLFDLVKLQVQSNKRDYSLSSKEKNYSPSQKLRNN